MEPVHEQVRMKIPAEAVELYTRYIHGEVSRRDFLRGVKRFAIAGLSAEALVQALMPNYALGQQVRKDDERIKATYETIPSPNGNGYIRGYFVRPFSQDSRAEKPTKLPAVLVVHENRGLNPHTEDVARRFALENFIAFAPDALTTVGGYPTPADVAKIKAAVLMHHGGLDETLVKAYPAYEAELKKNNVPIEVHIWPNSVHGFFNDATPERYNKATAPQAWARTIEWFNQYSRLSA